MFLQELCFLPGFKINGVLKCINQKRMAEDSKLFNKECLEFLLDVFMSVLDVRLDYVNSC